jgi:hypothetical protein
MKLLFPKLFITILAWANGRGRHWSHILTYFQQEITPSTPPLKGKYWAIMSAC